jgi:hypothetical protein
MVAEPRERRARLHPDPQQRHGRGLAEPVRERGVQVVDAGQRGPGAGGDLGADRRRRDALRGADEQLHAEVALDPAQHGADGGLGETEPRGRLADAAGRGDRLDHPEVVGAEVHERAPDRLRPVR